MPTFGPRSMLCSIQNGGLNFSLRKLLFVFTALVVAVAIATTYLRTIASRPNLQFVIDIEFSTTYSPPALEDLALTICEMMPESIPNRQSVINELIGNGNLRTYSRVTNSCQIVAAGKSWNSTSERIETIARATANAVIARANQERIGASINSEIKTASISRVPTTVLEEMDRTNKDLTSRSEGGTPR